MWNSWAEYQRVASMQPTLERDARLAEYTRELLRDEESRQRRRANRNRLFRSVLQGLGRSLGLAKPARATMNPACCG